MESGNKAVFKQERIMGEHDVVCHQHFKASDFKETLLCELVYKVYVYSLLIIN